MPFSTWQLNKPHCSSLVHVFTLNTSGLHRTQRGRASDLLCSQWRGGCSCCNRLLMALDTSRPLQLPHPDRWCLSPERVSSRWLLRLSGRHPALLFLSGDWFISNSCSSQGFPEKQPVQCYLSMCVRDLSWEWAHVIMEAEKAHHLPSAGWRPKRVGVSRGLRTGSRWREPEAGAQNQECARQGRR